MFGTPSASQMAISPGMTPSKHSRMLASSACDWLLRTKIASRCSASTS
jgi:hypothetical protein